MPWIVTTRSHGGRRWYLRQQGGVATDRGRAARFPTQIAAQRALVRKRSISEIDSAWQHGEVISDDAPDPMPPRPKIATVSSINS